jgi:hypothetical protein
MILDYISPVRVFKTLSVNIDELVKYQRYKTIIRELSSQGKLDAIGFKLDGASNLYLGIDLNPELLMYSETSQESVELKLISEKMNKYNDFLTNEGILDSIKVDYDRVQSDVFYGYVLQISFRFTQYTRRKLIYSISYFASALSIIAATIITLL